MPLILVRFAILLHVLQFDQNTINLANLKLGYSRTTQLVYVKRTGCRSFLRRHQLAVDRPLDNLGCLKQTELKQLEIKWATLESFNLLRCQG